MCFSSVFGVNGNANGGVGGNGDISSQHISSGIKWRYADRSVRYFDTNIDNALFYFPVQSSRPGDDQPAPELKRIPAPVERPPDETAIRVTDVKKAADGAWR